MEKKPRWTAKKKKALVLELLREKRTAGEICRENGISQSTLYEWRNLFLAKGGEGLQYGGKSRQEALKDKKIAQMERKLGQVMLENEILKKKHNWIDALGERRRSGQHWLFPQYPEPNSWFFPERLLQVEIPAAAARQYSKAFSGRDAPG